MLPKKNRLTKKKDIELVFKKGSGFRSGILLFKSLPNHLSCSRFAFVVSKKVSLKAVRRNTLRRRLRVAAKEIIPKFARPMDVVVVALPGALDKTVAQLHENLKEFSKKYPSQS